MQSMVWSFLMLLVVLALIPLSLWGLKRMQAIRPGGASRQLELVAQLALGARERVVLVRVQGRVLVLGATAQQISLLGEADAVEPAAPGTPAAPAGEGFAQQLAAFRAAARGGRA